MVARITTGDVADGFQAALEAALEGGPILGGLPTTTDRSGQSRSKTDVAPSVKTRYPLDTSDPVGALHLEPIRQTC